MMRHLHFFNSFLKLAHTSVKFKRDIVEVINVIIEFGAQNLSRKQFLRTWNIVSL
jgi:hypothetical protein